MEFICSVCKQAKENGKYGINDKGEKICYACCANGDRTRMKETGKIVLYLTVKFNGKSKLTNWPGSLVFNQPYVRAGRHNWGLPRYDVWFVFDGFLWWGVRYGDNTELCYCKRTKNKA